MRVFEIQIRYSPKSEYEIQRQWVVYGTEPTAVGAIEKAKQVKRIWKDSDIRVVPVEETWNSNWE